LAVDDVAHADQVRCVGCGVCAVVCPAGAMMLVRRPAEEVTPVSVTLDDWMRERAVSRGVDFEAVR